MRRFCNIKHKTLACRFFDLRNASSVCQGTHSLGHAFPTQGPVKWGPSRYTQPAGASIRTRRAVAATTSGRTFASISCHPYLSQSLRPMFWVESPLPASLRAGLSVHAGNIMKANLTRRAVINGGTALATAGALTGPTLLNWAKAWAQTVPWKPEKGAQLSMLRWKYFFRGEDDGCVAVMNAFTKATGVKVNITRESNDDVQPKASVAANTGAGPDMVWGYFSLPHLFPQKCLDVSDVAEYLGKKYGGWVASAIPYGKGKSDKWIDLPIYWSGNVMNYRRSSLKQAGFSGAPGYDRRVSRVREGDKEEQ
jgi:hypothetical protein